MSIIHPRAVLDFTLFLGGGGEEKDYVCARISQAQSLKSLSAHLRALEALGVFDAISCYLRLIF